jgi:hypothetical protein
MGRKVAVMLRGERVRLRALESENAEVVWRWHQNHEFHVLDGWLYPASLAQITAWVESVSVSAPSLHREVLGIETDAGALIGTVSLKRADAAHRNADFGIAIERASGALDDEAELAYIPVLRFLTPATPLERGRADGPAADVGGLRCPRLRRRGGSTNVPEGRGRA